MFVVCPACGHTYPITESKGEARLHCEKCKASFFVELDDSPPPAPAAPQPVTPPAKPPAPSRTVMATSAALIHCSCPRCRKPLEAPASWAGQKMTCSGCGQRLQLPAASPPAVAAPNRTVLAESMPAPPTGPAHLPASTFASQPSPAGTGFHVGSAAATLERPDTSTDTHTPRRGNMGLMLGLMIGGGLLFVGALVILLIVFNSGGGGRGSNPLMGKWESVGTPQTVRLDINAGRLTMSADVVVNLGYRIVDASNLEIIFDDATVADLERTYSKTLSPEERAGLLKTVRMTYQIEGDSLTVRDPTGEVRYRRVR